jgi:uncharacterized protein
MNNKVYWAVIAAVGFIIGSFVFANAYKYKFKTNETISVTGLAEKEFTSDHVVWSGDYSKKAMDLKQAYAAIKEDETKIKAYLVSKGVAVDEMVVSAININKDFNNKYDPDGRISSSEFTGYRLSQTITIDSKNLDKVEKISREVTELIESGIELNSSQPEYYYSKLADLKLELLGKASDDARQRAKTIAKNSDQGLGNLKQSKMGVFQILGLNSNEDFSEGGTFNTSSRNKKASITIRSDFFIK